MQPVPELPPHRIQKNVPTARDSKVTKINLPIAHITEL
jgi:hypothetical protein